MERQGVDRQGVERQGVEKQGVAPPAIDPEELLEQLKSQHRVLRWEPLAPEQLSSGREQARAGVNLEYLHHHWQLPITFTPTPAPGIRGRLRNRLGALVFRTLTPYLTAEQELLVNMVRATDALEKRCDELTDRIDTLRNEVMRRQVAEAKNQAELAAWLTLDRPSELPIDAEPSPSASDSANTTSAGTTSDAANGG